MITQEKAKQLKEAGFPESRSDIAVLDEKSGITYYHPTLSELIEACGEDFEELVKMNYGWDAHGLTENTHSGIEHGLSPEEAVANLYLELHK